MTRGTRSYCYTVVIIYYLLLVHIRIDTDRFENGYITEDNVYAHKKCIEMNWASRHLCAHIGNQTEVGSEKDTYFKSPRI